MEYEIDIPEELDKYILPKLTLQPLVENALYHGIKIRRRKGLIRVSGRIQDENIILEVADDGSGMSEERLQELRDSLADGRPEGFGLRTVHQRIQILFGAEYGLSLESTPDIGTKIFVKIPMKTSEKEMGA
jgi:two-component system sensor histidine kinase YesM